MTLSLPFTQDSVLSAKSQVESSGLCFNTPLITNVEAMFPLTVKLSLHLKLENMQNAGSFKIRGIVNQLPKKGLLRTGASGAITMSAGNYGRSFAYVTRRMGVPATVCMPETAPANRAAAIQDLGAEVMRMPASELQPTVDRLVQEKGLTFCHPFDDVDLIQGYGSLGLEILATVAQPDVILVPCGGGGLLAGVSSAIRLFHGSQCKIYGVEPATANNMWQSFQQGAAAKMPTAKSVAAGLAPPYTGTDTYAICRQCVDDILLVSDTDITAATRCLFKAGLKVEPSGSAGVAALLAGKVPGELAGKNVVTVLSGGNVSPEELVQLFVDA